MDKAQPPSPQYAVTIRLEYPHAPGWMAKISTAIAAQSGVIGAVDLVNIHHGRSLRDFTVECASTDNAKHIINALRAIGSIEVKSVSDDTFLLHLGGKLEIRSKSPLKTRADLSMAYTPGVARVCRAISNDPTSSFNLTIRKNCIAVVSDGSAVLGLGNIGPEAAMPVMEGKAILFKEFGGVDAFPLCVATQDAQAIIDFCRLIAPTFGGINLEDISAPRCFEIEARLKQELDIPVFHDDQHGTAVVVLAALINALKIVEKQPADLKVVVAGAGAAGMACTRTLLDFGIENIVVCDRQGAIHEGRDFGDNQAKAWLAEHTNPTVEQGMLTNVIGGADLFLGVSAPRLLSRENILRMGTQPIVFAMSNPVPEVMPEEVHDIVAVMGTGRSDYANQINNVLAFPGIFQGALHTRASDINEPMKVAAAHAIARVIKDDELSPDYVIPSIFDRRVTQSVSRAVSKAAKETGVARRIPKEANASHLGL